MEREMQLTEISPGSDVVTAVFNSEMETGESFDPPICIGHYKGQNEVFIMQGGIAMNIQNCDINKFCQQLKRAAKLALEQVEP
jgi:hypothetical protein